MALSGLLVFSGAYILAVASPGPGIAALVAQVLGRGIRAAPAFILGILAGDLLWFATAALGLAALAQAYAGIFVVVKWAGAAYLLFLAWKMWTTRVEAIDTAPALAKASHPKLFLSGLSLTLGNPKAIAFFLALLPVILDLGDMTYWGFAEIALLIAVILPGVLMAYALSAHAARRFFRSPRAVRNLNRVSGAVIASAAIAIAARG